MDKIVLIDCNNLAFKVFFKAKNIYFNKNNTYNNIKTNWELDPHFIQIITKLFVNTFKKIMRKHDVEYENLYVVADSPKGILWRRKLYENYKKPSEKKIQQKKELHIKNIFDIIFKHIIPQINAKTDINFINHDETEADDIIAILTEYFSKEYKVIIISSDKDYLQLLDMERVELYDINNNKIEKDENSSKKILLEKILRGDRSDNIPGIGGDLINFFLRKPEFLYYELYVNKDFRDKFCRNRNLIDFSYIPLKIKNSVINKLVTC